MSLSSTPLILSLCLVWNHLGEVQYAQGIVQGEHRFSVPGEAYLLPVIHSQTAETAVGNAENHLDAVRLGEIHQRVLPVPDEPETVVVVTVGPA